MTITVPASGTPNPVDSGKVSSVSVMAMDTMGHAMTFQWSAACPAALQSNGSFANASLSATQWTAPVNRTASTQDCTITVLVTDGAFGQEDDDSYVQTVPEPSALFLGLSALATLGFLAQRGSRIGVGIWNRR